MALVRGIEPQFSVLTRPRTTNMLHEEVFVKCYLVETEGIEPSLDACKATVLCSVITKSPYYGPA